MTSGPSVLAVRGLSRSFGSIRAVRDVGLVVDRGRIVGLLGENGAGKSTTIRIVLGFLRKDGGEFVLGSGMVGYVPEQPAFFPWVRGDELLAATAALFGIPPNVEGNRVRHWGGRILFPAELLRRRVATYSQGNRKKFAYLQSLILEPDLFIADEPFTALDPASIRNVREVFRELASRGCGVLLSSHLIAEVAKIYDDLVVIHRGETVLRERREDLGPAADLEALFLRTTGQEPAARREIPVA